MKKNNTEIIILILVIIPFLAAAFFWERLPDRLAIHFNTDGNANGFGSKAVGLLFLPVLNVLVYFLLKFLPQLTKSKETLEQLSRRYNSVRLLIHCFITALYLIIVLYTLEQKLNVLLFLAYGILILLLVTGNYLNNLKPNNFFGIRTVWTMRNDEVWRKTHHFTSRLWVLASLLVMMILPFLSQLLLSRILILYFIVIAIPPIIYSYVLSKKIITN